MTQTADGYTHLNSLELLQDLVVDGNATIVGTLTVTGSISDGSDIVLANGKALKTDSTNAHTALIQAYDVDGTAYKTFITLTNANTPSLALAAPSGGSVTIDGAVIGSTTPAAATVSTLVATTVNGNTITTGTGTLTLAAGTTFTGPASSGTAMTLGNTESVTGTKTFSNSAIKLLGSSTGATTFTSGNAGATNFTLTVPAVTGTIASTTGANLFVNDVYRSSASVTANGTVTPQTITGLAGAVAIGTYRFRAVLPSTVASGTGGIAYNFLLTTAVLSSIQYGATMKTASALQYTQGTTTTSGTVIATQAAVVLETIVEGTFVVSTAGTFTLQMAQNTSNGSNSITLIGSTMELTRIA